jgi:hypothetical protein
MEQAENNPDLGLWRTARTLWIKYCGIADEYKMMRDRWLYLHGENKLMVLPYLRRDNKNGEEKTFDLLDGHTNKLESSFEKIGFKRSDMENFSNFADNAGVIGDVMNRVELINKLKLIEECFYDLSNFVGLLKSAFFQRTVSTEIQHVVSGLPHSPERTIGNELFFLAADNVARSYYKCLNIPYGKWDGFITFIPPIEEYFYGAFFQPSQYLKLFHISMSEEAKYFVGGYLFLAHELGHAVMNRRIKENGTVEMLEAFWIHNLFDRVYSSTQEFLIDHAGYRCQKCPILTKLSKPSFVFETLIELMADITSVYIGGINCTHSFIDFVHNTVSNRMSQIPILLRIISNYHYLKQNGFDVADLKKRIENIVEEAEKIREDSGYFCPLNTNFSNCIAGICAEWVREIIDFDKNFERSLLDGLEENIVNLPYQYNPSQGSINANEILRKENLEKIGTLIFPEQDSIPTKKSSLFSMIVKEKFYIGDNEKREIKEALSEGRPITKKDPRQILHCYYEAYKESLGEERPNYAATIYSLAFNEHEKNNSQIE